MTKEQASDYFHKNWKLFHTGFDAFWAGYQAREAEDWWTDDSVAAFIGWITQEVKAGRLRNHTNGDFRNDSTGQHYTYKDLIKLFKGEPAALPQPTPGKIRTAGEKKYTQSDYDFWQKALNDNRASYLDALEQITVLQAYHDQFSQVEGNALEGKSRWLDIVQECEPSIQPEGKEGIIFSQKRVHIPSEYAADLNEEEYFVKWDEPDKGLKNLSLPLHPDDDHFRENLQEGKAVKFHPVYYCDTHESFDCAKIQPVEGGEEKVYSQKELDYWINTANEAAHYSLTKLRSEIYTLTSQPKESGLRYTKEDMIEAWIAGSGAMYDDGFPSFVEWFKQYKSDYTPSTDNEKKQ